MLVLFGLGALLLDSVRLGNINHVEDNEHYGKNSHGDEQGRSGIADRGTGHISHQVTYQNRDDRCRNRIERTAELNQLVALLTAAAQRVEHRIDHRIEHAHREARDECAHEVNGKTACLTRKILDTDTDEPDGHSCQSRLLVTDPIEHHTGRNTHHGIGDEIGKIAQLRHPVRYGELILDDYAQRVCETRHERNHGKEREHHDDGQRVILFLFHTCCFEIIFRLWVIFRSQLHITGLSRRYRHRDSPAPSGIRNPRSRRASPRRARCIPA